MRSSGVQGNHPRLLSRNRIQNPLSEKRKELESNTARSSRSDTRRIRLSQFSQRSLDYSGLLKKTSWMP
jgi:hypothetical protein